MANVAMTVSGLLKVGEEEFDGHIKAMSIKDLMEMISGLQKEMAKEQENFNFLSGELQNRKERNSRQYKQISKDMVASQQRLTLLMNRSMKCFSQGNNANNAATPPQPSEPEVFINGKPQQAWTAPQRAESNNSGPSELELATAQMRNRRDSREIIASVTTSNNNSTITSPDEYVRSSEQEKIAAEKQRAGPFILQQGEPNKQSSVTVKSINTVDSLANSNIRASSGGNTIQANTPSLHATASADHQAVRNSSTDPVAKSSPLTVLQSNRCPSPFDRIPSDDDRLDKPIMHITKSSPETQQQQNNYKPNSMNNSASRPPSNGALFNHTSSSSTSSHQRANPAPVGRAVVPTAAVTIRKSKSREQLQDVEHQTRVNKDSLLKQIQARGQNLSSIKDMSKLSQSMPSLLQEDEVVGRGTKSSPIKSGVKLAPREQATTLGGEQGQGQDDDVVEKSVTMNLRDWDPNLVLAQLYKIKLMEEIVEDISHQFVSMEGLMEKLPMNKKKATLLKTWKRRFFKAKDGWLYYYESSNRDRPSETIQLMGGAIHDMGNRVLGIDDGRGRYLMVRCPTEKEYGQWKVALESQTADNTKATYVRPKLVSHKHSMKNIIIMDLGSSAIRAGILGEQACLPSLFFPSVLAVDKKMDSVVEVGEDALKPDVRQPCRIVHPIRPTNKVDQFNIEVQYLKPIFDKIFKDLKVNNPADFWVMVSTPQNLGDPLKAGLMACLVDSFNVRGVCMVQQALLSLYSYNATSGIIVDIGHRIEILPIFDGFVIEGDVARCPYGAQKVQESLTTSLLGNNFKFASSIEQLLVRYAMEESCYVAQEYAQEEEWFKSQPSSITRSVSFSKFKLPEGAYTSVELGLSRFRSPEGFFNVDLWEMDYPTLHKLIHQAIQTCPMDNRRHMWRAVFLSGGVTMLPGFAERLERELTKLAPPGVPVEVHAAPQRYHAAYVGACSVALMPQFEDMAISREEWKQLGNKAFRKWQAPTS